MNNIELYVDFVHNHLELEYIGYNFSEDGILGVGIIEMIIDENSQFGFTAGLLDCGVYTFYSGQGDVPRVDTVIGSIVGVHFSSKHVMVQFAVLPKFAVMLEDFG